MANNSSTFFPLPGTVINLTELHMWFVIAFLIGLIGTIAGVALLIVILRQHNFRDGTGPLIVQLLGLDCFTLAIPTFLANLEVYLTQLGNPGHINCKAVFFIAYYLTCVSHLISVALALNRVTAVLIPHYFRTCSSPASIATMTIFSWVCPLCFSVPFLFGVGASFGELFPLGSCSLLVTNFRLFGILSTIMTTLPLCFEGICYAIVLAAFRCQQRGTQQPSNRNDARRQKRKSKENMISLVLLICFLWYLVCYLPTALISTYMGWFWRTHWNVFIWMRTLFNTAQAGTPFILMLGNAEYRAGVSKLLTGHLSAIAPILSSKFSTSGNGRSNALTADKSVSVNKY